MDFGEKWLIIAILVNGKANSNVFFDFKKQPFHMLHVYVGSTSPKLPSLPFLLIGEIYFII